MPSVGAFPAGVASYATHFCLAPKIALKSHREFASRTHLASANQDSKEMTARSLLRLEMTRTVIRIRLKL